MNSHTVLIVDDELAIRDMLRMALEMADFRCIAVLLEGFIPKIQEKKGGSKK